MASMKLEEQLEQQVYLIDKYVCKFQVNSHTSAEGGEANNWKLPRRRGKCAKS
jgi:hypothetical protein